MYKGGVNMFDLKDLGQRIKNRRIEMNMTQEALAFKVGYTSRSSINKIELGGVDLTQSKIVAIANALDISPIELLGYEYKDSKTQFTAHEINLVLAYREHKKLQMAIDEILGISKRATILNPQDHLYSAASSVDNKPPIITRKTKDEWYAIETAPETDEDLK